MPNVASASHIFARSVCRKTQSEFWLGHGDKTVTDGYSQLKQDTEYRKAVIQQAGIGFVIPPVVQNVQKSE